MYESGRAAPPLVNAFVSCLHKEKYFFSIKTKAGALVFHMKGHHPTARTTQMRLRSAASKRCAVHAQLESTLRRCARLSDCERSYSRSHRGYTFSDTLNSFTGGTKNNAQKTIEMSMGRCFCVRHTRLEGIQHFCSSLTMTILVYHMFTETSIVCVVFSLKCLEHAISHKPHLTIILLFCCMVQQNHEYEVSKIQLCWSQE